MRVSWLFLAVLLIPAGAQAHTDDQFAYPFSRVWTAAVRLLRIDMACPITEKDKEEGYFFFDYPSETGKFPGSIELVETQVDGVKGVKVIVKVPAMPSYFERLVLDKLGRKLKAEFGPPLTAKTPKTAPVSADGKADGKERSGGDKSGSEKQKPESKGQNRESAKK
jgi:hypothetical protein